MKLYEMTTEEHATLLKACQPVPYLVVGGIPPRSPRENANTAWKALAQKRGFKWDTVEPAIGKGSRFFMADPVVE